MADVAARSDARASTATHLGRAEEGAMLGVSRASRYVAPTFAPCFATATNSAPGKAWPSRRLPPSMPLPP